MRSALAAAETFEKAELGVQSGQQDVEARASAYDVAARRAGEALAAFEAAEQDLAHVQALHLASRLSSGEPCPVCGAIEHPAPATGAVEHAGRDQAFRDAKAAWQAADDAARGAEQNLVGSRSVLEERRNRLASLARPEEPAAAIRERETAVQAELDALGPETDLAEAEAEIDRQAGEIETLEKAREALREHFAELQGQTAAKKAQLDELLSAVPEHLRDNAALCAAQESAARSLAERQEVRAAAETAATETREFALGALRDLGAAEKALTACRGRHARAIEHFRSRLRETGLIEEDYQALKPAIATIEEDRARIDDFRRKLGAAETTAKNAADAVGDQARPDMNVLEAARGDAEAKLTEAADLRSGAGHRWDRLTKLLDECMRPCASSTRRRLPRAIFAASLVW